MKTTYCRAVVLGLMLLAAGRAPAQETPRELIERAIRAHGGMQRLSRVRADKVKLRGTLEVNGKQVPFTANTTVQLPAQYRNVTEVNVDGRRFVLVHVLNGDKALMTLDGQPQKIEPAALAEMRETLQLDRAVRLVPLLTDRTFDLAPLGEDKVNGRPVVGLKVSARGRKELRLYFERATGLLVKTEHTLSGSDGKDLRQEQFYSNFKDIEGYRRPTRVVAYRNGKKLMEADLIDVRYVDRIDDSEFHIP